MVNEDFSGNWLGKAWQKLVNRTNPTFNTYPTFREVKEGLIAEAMVQLKNSMWKVQDAKAHLEAKKNISEQWEIVMKKA